MNHEPRTAVLAAFFLLAGCKTGQYPNPNDPAGPQMIDGEVLRGNVQSAAEHIFARVPKGELTDQEAKELLRKYADSMAANVKIDQVPPDEAWEYAEVMRSAQRWKDAKTLLEVAVKAADGWDRKVNDGLRLAQVEAKLGDVDKAIAEARKTFAAPPSDKVPILPAVLFEVVPSALGLDNGASEEQISEASGGNGASEAQKKKDANLAKLLEDAAEQGAQAAVDANTDDGKLFLAARPTHQRRAIIAATDLYRAAGQPDAAEKAGQHLLEIESKEG